MAEIFDNFGDDDEEDGSVDSPNNADKPLNIT